jgi:hypothetical protein
MVSNKYTHKETGEIKLSVQYNPKIITDGLVLCLDAANPKSYGGSGTTWTDLSGLGNTGTLVNGVGYNASNGGSLSFDGVDDYVNLGSFFTYQNFTISLWVSPGSATQSQYANIFDNNHTGIINFVLQQNNLNHNEYGFGVNLNPNPGSGVNLPTLAVNVWTHLAFTFTPSDRVIGYVNGSFYNQGNLANNKNILYSNQKLSIARWSNGGRHWNGRISNFSVYNRVLSAAEVQRNFLAMRGRFGI